MAIYDKKTVMAGSYADKAELFKKGASGKKAKIVSETNDQPSRKFTDKNGNPQIEHVCKVQFEGEPEAVITQLNQATINGLVDAFGGDSKNWQGKYLTVRLDKQLGNKYFLYFIPEGYEAVEDEEGWIAIAKKGSVVSEPPLDPDMNDIKPSDIPF